MEDQISRFSARIAKAMESFTEAAQHLRTISEVAQQSAEVIVVEVGTDMTKFPTAGHLCSWARLCRGNNESAGKRRTGKTTKESQWLRTTLVQCAWAASHTKNQTVFTACFHRLAKRLPKKKALVAVAHKMLVVIWHLQKKKAEYKEQCQVAPLA